MVHLHPMSLDELKRAALEYHEHPKPGKTAIQLTKATETQWDLSLAYSPGVAQPVLEIAKDADNAYRYTNKSNLVGVISNGSAILGLGNLGALASKPVMEGKAVLFKRFADVDVFDIEVNEKNPDKFIEIVKSLAPTFGGINLEDIKAPECFHIEHTLDASLDIPIFHDDQHGTAIVVAAGLLNALELQGKELKDAHIVIIGAGAAGIATCNLLLKLGAKKHNLYMVDRAGVIHTERKEIKAHKVPYASNTKRRTIADALDGADVVIGVSGANLFGVDELNSLADNPVIFALSNPDPEIHPDLVKQYRADAIMATGRSDFPNQVNNVICFPYIFRAALDVRAHSITSDMCVAAVEAIRQLAQQPVPQEVIDLYPTVDHLEFGPDYVIPKPMDPRLLECVSKAVKQAAIDSGVAQTK